MEKQNILLLGSGGREHALAWKLKQSPLLNNLHIAPGNAGTSYLGKQVNLSVNDFDGIKKYCLEELIDIIVVGPEDPLVKGIVDYFKTNAPKIYVFGPNKMVSQLEGSKDFSKKFMQRHHIPTAKYQTFTKGEESKASLFLESMKAPYVLKADGLAAGKGVLIIHDLNEAQKSATEMLNGKFGSASEVLVIEEFLDGVEVSFFALCNGEDYVLLPEAKDYKRIGEGDTGLNTGGMGAVSPVPFVDDEFEQKVIFSIVDPTIKGLNAEGMPYVGFLFFGLINVDGEPKVIEYNCRMGDPETEVVIPRLNSDLLEAILRCKENNLGDYKAEINPKPCSTVIAVSGGYPESYQKGIAFSIKKEVHEDDGVYFYAGVKKDEMQNLLTNGGRVVACTAWGQNAKEALTKSYEMMDEVNFANKYFRTDIGSDIL
jgi:phosphoribosylamine--glycine ligase